MTRDELDTLVYLLSERALNAVYCARCAAIEPHAAAYEAAQELAIIGDREAAGILARMRRAFT